MVVETRLKELIEKNRIFFHFLELCKIPHGSYQEKEISDFIVGWSKGIGLEVKQDEYSNIFIKKPASKGYENKKAIILQAHIDMVCEKLPEVEHDFKKDPIITQLDGDILSTGNKTTLGADNGIGVAMAMAILEDKTLKHPEVHVIFTTAEEEDMSGALNVSKSWFHTDRVINLDNTIDSSLIVGSSGGKGTELQIPVSYQKHQEEEMGVKISIYGLTGGHSGEDIEKGRANANILLARLLTILRKKLHYTISSIKGGSFRLAIPRAANVVVAISQDNYSLVKEVVESFEKSMKKIYENTEKNIAIQIEEPSLDQEGLTEESSKKIVETILLSPNGISENFIKLGVVESSCNLGEVFIRENYAHFVTEIRGVFEENVEYIYDKIQSLGENMGGEGRDFAPYPSWLYKEDSELRNIASQTYEEMFHDTLEISVVHGGLECGCFSLKIPDMDAISIGPNIWDLHSPYERVSVSSTNKSYSFLQKILENLD